MKITITLVDTDDGMVGQTINYHGEYDQTSNAHKYGNIMVGLAMDASKSANTQSFDLSHIVASGPVSELKK